jgi:hypothetical protein
MSLSLKGVLNFFAKRLYAKRPMFFVVVFWVAVLSTRQCFL